MLYIFKNKQNSFNDKSFNTNYILDKYTEIQCNSEILCNYERDEYINRIFYPSTMLRGHVKSNSQYTIIDSKTRNGSFGLKG